MVKTGASASDRLLREFVTDLTFLQDRLDVTDLLGMVTIEGLLRSHY